MNESKYKLKSVSTDSVIACVLGGLSIMGLIVALIISYRFDGEGPILVGLLGSGSFIFSVIGFLFSLCSWRTVSGSLILKRIGSIATAAPAIFCVILFMIGVVR